MADAVEVSGVPLAKMTKVYLKIKAERDRLSAEYKEADDKLVRQQDKIKSTLLGYLKENDIKSVKTDAGTFYRTVKQKYWTSDWENMHKFILEWVRDGVIPSDTYVKVGKTQRFALAKVSEALMAGVTNAQPVQPEDIAAEFDPDEDA